MPLTSLETFAEKKAAEAENLYAFHGVKLISIKNNVAEALALIGRDGFFGEYTRHDISHVDEMIKISEWLIPDETKNVMTKADWLLLVLAFYFHDFGMIVSSKEYDAKDSNLEYLKFKEMKKKEGAYEHIREKINNVADEDKFLYQEFVRETHSQRVKDWIDGSYAKKYCASIPQADEIKKLLSNLSLLFKKDLAIVCKSHQSDDINDFHIYNTDARYGNEEEEKANIHYISIILRTADLLHITKNRTPSIQFSIISPSDPTSILEWQKQNAVVAVFPRPRTNKEGNVDEHLQKDTIQVKAFFGESEQAEAYFGLSAYLEYARKQIQKSFFSINKSIEKKGTGKYCFPWREIYEDITTEGFEKNKLQFELDKDSILNLLVGNTLYNDFSVALRELVQNSIDAINLQTIVNNRDGSAELKGEIHVKWNRSSRYLRVLDNGTGMNAHDIENHLLKVGSSKYRSEEFRKEFPDFYAISRFGIGVLTCFMIADDIDIITNSQTEEYASKITIKNVSGKYLLKKICKHTLDPLITHHGTEFILKLRSDINMDDIEGLMRKWIVLPKIPVRLFIDSLPPISIGFASPKEAIQAFLSENNIANYSDKVEVKTETIGELHYHMPLLTLLI